MKTPLKTFTLSFSHKEVSVRYLGFADGFGAKANTFSSLMQE